MNKLNGGYVMVSHDASQDELKSAYESFKPVIYYDATGRAFYATITELGGTYSVETLSGAIDDLKAKKLYSHVVLFKDDSNTSISILLYTNSNEPFTADTFKEHIKTLVNNVSININACGYISGTSLVVGITYATNTIKVRHLSSSFTVSTGEFASLTSDTITEIL